MTPQAAFAIMIGLILVQRIVELRMAKANEAWARAAGAQEHGAKHYPLFFLLHGGWAAGWITEACWGGLQLATWAWLWLGLFVLAQVLRYWALASLGRYWNTRILVIPGHTRVASGIYQILPHPNYLAVALELAAVPLLFGAWKTALVASLLNAVLLLGVRIPAENKALASLKKSPKSASNE